MKKKDKLMVVHGKTWHEANAKCPICDEVKREFKQDELYTAIIAWGEVKKKMDNVFTKLVDKHFKEVKNEKNNNDL